MNALEHHLEIISITKTRHRSIGHLEIFLPYSKWWHEASSLLPFRCLERLNFVRTWLSMMVIPVFFPSHRGESILLFSAKLWIAISNTSCPLNPFENGEFQRFFCHNLFDCYQIGRINPFLTTPVVSATPKEAVTINSSLLEHWNSCFIKIQT